MKGQTWMKLQGCLRSRIKTETSLIDHQNQSRVLFLFWSNDNKLSTFYSGLFSKYYLFWIYNLILLSKFVKCKPELFLGFTSKVYNLKPVLINLMYILINFFFQSLIEDIRKNIVGCSKYLYDWWPSKVCLAIYTRWCCFGKRLN